MTGAQRRAASVLRQRIILALLEFGADLGAAPVEEVAANAIGLEDLRTLIVRRHEAIRESVARRVQGGGP